jgi:hypothetical protein
MRRRPSFQISLARATPAIHKWSASIAFPLVDAIYDILFENEEAFWDLLKLSLNASARFAITPSGRLIIRRLAALARPR